MEVVAYLIGMVITNKRGFYKKTIEKLTKDWPGGSYLVLSSNPMVPRGRLLIAIGYKYNMQKVLCFIITENSRITQAGITHLYNYSDHFSFVAIHPVYRPLVVYKFFEYVNEFDSNNKPRQYDLALETLCACA